MGSHLGRTLFPVDPDDIYSGAEQQVDQLVAGAVRLCGKGVQLGQQRFLHADGDHLMPVFAPAGRLFVIRISSAIGSPHFCLQFTLTEQEIIYYNM